MRTKGIKWKNSNKWNKEVKVDLFKKIKKESLNLDQNQSKEREADQEIERKSITVDLEVMIERKNTKNTVEADLVVIREVQDLEVKTKQKGKHDSFKM